MATTYLTFPTESNNLSFEANSTDDLRAPSDNNQSPADPTTQPTGVHDQDELHNNYLSSSVQNPPADTAIDMDPFVRDYSQHGMQATEKEPQSRCRLCLNVVLYFFLQDDVKKFLLAFLYLACVMVFLSHLLVVVHYRMPNNATWGPVKPLPDIFLDWIPQQMWGFVLSEVLITTMTAITFLLAIFHAHTFIVLRRMFCVTGTVFFLRAFSVLVTSMTPSVLPLPAACAPLKITSVGMFIEKALRILVGMGMRLHDGQTCGDYVYSGHTCSLTIFNLFFLTYGPNNIYFIPLKALTSAINLLGVTGIIISHEHYTVDVLLALAISYLVFVEYHHVAVYLQITMKQANQATSNCPPVEGDYSLSTDLSSSSFQRRHRYLRLKITAPVTYFMERNGEGRVENTLRIPFFHFIATRQWTSLPDPARS